LDFLPDRAPLLVMEVASSEEATLSACGKSIFHLGTGRSYPSRRQMLSSTCTCLALAGLLVLALALLLGTRSSIWPRNRGSACPDVYGVGAMGNSNQCTSGVGGPATQCSALHDGLCQGSRGPYCSTLSGCVEPVQGECPWSQSVKCSSAMACSAGPPLAAAPVPAPVRAPSQPPTQAPGRAPSKPNQACSTFENMDIVGENIAVAAGSTAEDCCQSCDKNPDCKSAVLYEGNCYLKSSLIPKNNPGRTTVVRGKNWPFPPQSAPSQPPAQAPARAPSQPPAQAPTQAPSRPPTQAPVQAPATPTAGCSTFENTDIVGENIAIAAGSTPEDCCRSCTANPDCKSAVLDEGQCYLKSALTPKTNPGRTTVVRGKHWTFPPHSATPPPPPPVPSTWQTIPNQRWEAAAGKAMAPTQESSAAACAQACQTQGGSAVSWDPQSQACQCFTDGGASPPICWQPGAVGAQTLHAPNFMPALPQCLSATQQLKPSAEGALNVPLVPASSGGPGYKEWQSCIQGGAKEDCSPYCASYCLQQPSGAWGALSSAQSCECLQQAPCYRTPGSSPVGTLRSVWPLGTLPSGPLRFSSAPVNAFQSGYVPIFDPDPAANGHVMKLSDTSTDYLFLMGDWGDEGPENPTGTYPCQINVAKAAKQYAFSKGKDPLVVCSLGDNFYWTGVGAGASSSGAWKTNYLDVYGPAAGERSLLSIPWLAVMGNHDLGTSDPFYACGFLHPNAKKCLVSATPTGGVYENSADCTPCGSVPAGPASKAVAGQPRCQAYLGGQFSGSKVNAGDTAVPPNWHMPDRNYFYCIPSVENNLIEVIAVDTNATDAGAWGGNQGTGAQQCATSDGVSALGEENEVLNNAYNLVATRGYESTARLVIIIQHYNSGYDADCCVSRPDGTGGGCAIASQLTQLFTAGAASPGSQRSKSTDPAVTDNWLLLSAFGHAHDTSCAGGPNHGGPTSNCTFILAGGSGGCCGGAIPRAGFVSVELPPGWATDAKNKVYLYGVDRSQNLDGQACQGRASAELTEGEAQDLGEGREVTYDHYALQPDGRRVLVRGTAGLRSLEMPRPGA